METRRYKNLDTFNSFKMQEFRLVRLEHGENSSLNLVFQADDGYPEHFGAEIRFLAMKYLACAHNFMFATLRLASVQEFSPAKRYQRNIIYCFEGEQIPRQPREQYYIIAKDVEITIHYAGENFDAVFGPRDRMEAGGQGD